jgi:hypothetical protein
MKTMIIENEVINMKLRFDTQEFPGIQVSLTAQELTTQLRHMMHAENLYLREGCVYRGHQFISSCSDDVQAIQAIETIERWFEQKESAQL